MNHLNRAFSDEIRETVQGQNLPLYQDGPGVDYSKAAIGYSTHVTVLHIPGFNPRKPQQTPVTPSTSALFVQRASGHGRRGSWGGVTGYVDVISDPEGKIKDAHFDPIAYTVRNELTEECGFTAEAFQQLHLLLAERFEVDNPYTGGINRVMPVAAVYSGKLCPKITINHELLGFSWVPAGIIPTSPTVSRGYVKGVWPRVLAALR